MEARNQVERKQVESKGMKVRLSEQTWWKSFFFSYDFFPDYKNSMITLGKNFLGKKEEWKKCPYSLATTTDNTDEKAVGYLQD